VIYKFKSKAAGDVIMLGPNGDQLLRLIGREPVGKGIVEPDAMAAAIVALQQAVASDEAQRSEPTREVSLRQRVWPMVEMMKRAQAAREPIVWGV
jgi:Domain of unknown function (DUF1840)